MRESTRAWLAAEPTRCRSSRSSGLTSTLSTANAACRVGRDVALDVSAETFAQALRSIATLDPDREAQAWLFGIATNVLRHHHRAETRRLRAYARVAHGDPPASSRGREADADTPVRERLTGALTGLDERDRETLLLFAWADLSYDEIAAALEIPVGTVRSRIHRARRTLRSALTRPEPDEAGLAAVGTEKEV